MKTSDFYYELPAERIAQTPAEPRDQCRLLVYDTRTGIREHRRFTDIVSYLRPGDALVINETRVLPARLLGVKESGGTPVELLLLKKTGADEWETLARPGRCLKPGAVCLFGGGELRAEVLAVLSASGGRIVRFTYRGAFGPILSRLGQTPLPPYILEKLDDAERYQTVYAQTEGSAAAPTAGLHFTNALLERVREAGVQVIPILLHVGLGTFRPVKVRDIQDHHMHAEYYEVSKQAAERINDARDAGGRVICVGTTCVRTLETVSDDSGRIHSGSGETDIFITPDYKLKAADALITNFHLPESTLLMLVAAFIGRETMLDIYREAILMQYRFFSFGDAMLIT